jgi:hypothetical protein
MSNRSHRSTRFFSLLLGVLTLLVSVVLLVWDMSPRLFPPGSHDFLGAFPLAAIAAAYLIYQRANRPSFGEWVRAILLAAAFLFWAANQLWPNLPQAVLFNDIAIGLFVLDVFLTMIGWPATSREEAIPEMVLTRKAAGDDTL